MKNKRNIEAGDMVRLTETFLDMSGQRATGEHKKRWTVIKVDDDGECCYVNEEQKTKQYTDEELKEEPCLRYRKINCNNLRFV
jgi:hypothetical protein